MSISSDIKRYVLNLLKSLPVCTSSGNGIQWTVRCPYCGDSKTINHGHFSIKLDLNSDEPILYRCFKCNESGILTSQTLEDLGFIVNQSVEKDLKNFNFKATRTSILETKDLGFKVPKFSPSASNLRHLQYLNERLGTNLTIEDCTEYKIILSYSEFLIANHIRPNPEVTYLKNGTIEALNRDYIGFLSANNNKITFRDTTGNGFFGRYYKITLVPQNLNPKNFYSLKNQFDLLYTDPIDVHIAEGTFDILGIYFNLPRENTMNQLYFASCGFNFGTIVKYLISIGITTDFNLHVYSDADKTDKDHLLILRKDPIGSWIDKIIIHRNSVPGEKDYGVPKEKIQDYYYELR